MFFESKLALRLRRPTTWYGLASISVIAALAVVVSLLTWWNDLYRPIVHPIEAITRVHPGEALEQAVGQVDEQVASLLGVDKENVRSVREGLIGGASSGIPQLAGKLYEVAAIYPAGIGSSWPASSSVLPKGDGAGAPPEEVSSPMLTEPSLTPVNGESPVPSADDTPALPAQGEEPPSSSPATETTPSPPGGSSSEPPTSTTDPSPVTPPADSSSSSEPTDSPPPPSTGSSPPAKDEPPPASDPSSPSTTSPPPSPSSPLSPPTGTAPPLLLTNPSPPPSPPLPSPTKAS